MTALTVTTVENNLQKAKKHAALHILIKMYNAQGSHVCKVNLLMHMIEEIPLMNNSVVHLNAIGNPVIHQLSSCAVGHLIEKAKFT